MNAIVNTKPHEFNSEITRWLDDTLMNGVEDDDSHELEAHDHDRWEVDDDPDYDL